MAFEIYKKGQGKYTRLGSAFAGATIAVIGCMELYVKLEAAEWWGLSRRAVLWIATMVPAGLFVVLGVLSFWLVNKPSVADFMIAAEGEMKKVNWSSKQEIAVSTVIVILVVLIISGILGVTDFGFQIFFGWLFETPSGA
jgi:preprotein translocase subunit SecE